MPTTTRCAATPGNDKLDGNLGIDKLTGGAGNDIFVFNAPRHRRQPRCRHRLQPRGGHLLLGERGDEGIGAGGHTLNQRPSFHIGPRRPTTPTTTLSTTRRRVRCTTTSTATGLHAQVSTCHTHQQDSNQRLGLLCNLTTSTWSRGCADLSTRPRDLEPSLKSEKCRELPRRPNKVPDLLACGPSPAGSGGHERTGHEQTRRRSSLGSVHPADPLSLHRRRPFGAVDKRHFGRWRGA